jgi:hypothetical protein
MEKKKYLTKFPWTKPELTQKKLKKMIFFLQLREKKIMEINL